jgi:hypothetical protein
MSNLVELVEVHERPLGNQGSWNTPKDTEMLQEACEGLEEISVCWVGYYDSSWLQFMIYKVA